MQAKYFLIVYIVFTVCYVVRQSWETVKQEREFINGGGRPLGDSTYITYALNLLFRVLLAIILILTVGTYKIPLTNFGIFIIIAIVSFVTIELVSATLETPILLLINKFHEKRYKERMDKRADELNEQLEVKRNSDK